MLQHINTIIFDLGGVLMDLDKQACIDAFKELGYENIEKLLGAYSQQGEFLELEEGKIGIDQFHKAVRHAIGKAVSDEDIDSAFCKFLINVPTYKLDMLLKLKKRYQVFMLSNTNPIMFDSKIPEIFSKQGLTINDYFDRFYLSYKMGMTKPNPEIFRQMIEESGIVPEDTLFLDDSRSNVDAAALFGFKTYMAAPNENFNHIFGL